MYEQTVGSNLRAMELKIAGDLPSRDILGFFPLRDRENDHDEFCLNWWLKDKDGDPVVAFAGPMSLMFADILVKAINDRDFMSRAGYENIFGTRPLPEIS